MSEFEQNWLGLGRFRGTDTKGHVCYTLRLDRLCWLCYTFRHSLRIKYDLSGTSFCYSQHGYRRCV